MTPDGAVSVISEALHLGLSGAEFLRDLGPARVAAACNGIGPEWLPEALREKLSKWLALFILPADIHDCRFSYCNDGTELGFWSANNELGRNCLLVADARYAWYNPVRYLARRGGRLVAAACQRYGWSAWRQAYHNKEEAK